MQDFTRAVAKAFFPKYEQNKRSCCAALSCLCAGQLGDLELQLAQQLQQLLSLLLLLKQLLLVFPHNTPQLVKLSPSQMCVYLGALPRFPTPVVTNDGF